MPELPRTEAERPGAPEPTVLRGLVVDWGGVLTIDIKEATRAWASAGGIDLAAYVAVMRDWFGGPIGDEARLNPVHALERGEMSMPDFEQRLAAALSARSGALVAPEGLLDGLLERFAHAPEMTALVRRAKHLGIRTALLSNSWGNDYPRDGWEEMFDVVVISGEIGMRKPEPRIFAHTVELLGLEARECVLVDDLPQNVAAGVAAGMVGVRHTSYAESLAELEVLFERDLT